MKFENSGIVFLLPAVLNKSSNGHKSIAWLIRFFCEQQVKCTLIVPSIDRFKQLSSIQLPMEANICGYNNLPESSSCVIANDTSSSLIVDKLRVNNHRIIWWLLAPPNILGSPFPDIHHSDSVAIYSSFVLPGLKKYYFIQESENFYSLKYKLASSDHVNINNSDKKKIAIYCGKGRLFLLPQCLEELISQYQISYFTRYKPKSRQSYEQLLLSCDALISYDSITAVILDFASLGKPVYLPNDPFPQHSYDAYPLSCLNNVYHDYEDWLSHLKFSSMNPQSSLLHVITELSEANKIAASNFSSLISCANSESQDQNISKMISSLNEYSSMLLFNSTIQPSLDGQAPSSRYLNLYIYYLRLPLRIRSILRSPFQCVLKSSDLLHATNIGRLILRLTFHLPWTVKSMYLRLVLCLRKILLYLNITTFQ